MTNTTVSGWHALLPLVLSCIMYPLIAMHVNRLVAPYVVTGPIVRGVDLETSTFDHPLEVNTKLRANIQHLAKYNVKGAETVFARGDRPNEVYFFTEDGWLSKMQIRVRAAGAGASHEAGFAPAAAPVPERLTFVGGRVLGAAFAPNGHVIACDMAKGLIAIDVDKGRIEVLSTAAPAHPTTRRGRQDQAAEDAQQQLQAVQYCDDVDIAPDGTVYFSDATDMRPYMMSSGHWTAMELFTLDILRGYGSGRLLAYHPLNHTTSTLLSNVYFANGVALAQDQSFVLVAETLNARIIRYWLTGKRAGSSEIFADLPCLPDGVSLAADGGFYVACPGPVTATFVIVSKYPMLRWILGNLPSFMWPPSPQYGLVLKLRSNGAPAYALHDPGGHSISFVTSVTEVFHSRFSDAQASFTSTDHRNGEAWLYLGSLHGDSIPRIRVPQREVVLLR